MAESPLHLLGRHRVGVLGRWWTRYAREFGDRASLDVEAFEEVFGEELLRLASTPAEHQVTVLERSGRRLAGRGVPLAELLSMSALGTAAIQEAVDPTGERGLAAMLPELERQRARALARVWLDQGGAEAPPPALSLGGRGPAGGFGAAPQGIDGLVGTSDAMRTVRAVASSVARSSGGVLLSGETGTGKEAVARAMHHARGWGIFLPVDCNRMTPLRAETELFGRLGGGLGREAVDCITGTLFLQDVTELNPDIQARLVPLLGDAGGARWRCDRSGPLVVLATAGDPERAALEGRLRPSLMRLLRPSSLALPPLRLRREDIGPLVEHFLGSFCARRCGCVWGVTREAMDLLEAWPWPGNVRELRDAVRFAVATGSGSAIEPKDLPPALQGGTSVVPVPEAASGIPTLAEAQLRIVQETLARFGGNKSRTARALAISRHKLYDMLEGCG
jgi:hypothetical protein